VVKHCKITNPKHQISIKSQIPIFKHKGHFGILNFGHCYLPFDLAQGGEHVEPFDICDLLFGIFSHFSTPKLQDSSTPIQPDMSAGKAIET
jgi:hypothetical protein